jgi:hypothetical protein
VRGRTVHFVKRYLGELFSGWRVGDRLIGTTRAGHAVQYRGTLSDDDDAIEGGWWIDPDPGSGDLRAEGGFRLQRQAE